VAQYLSNGKLKAYGMAAPERAQSAPDIKTFKEQDLGDVDGTIVYTLIAPPKTPPAIIAKLNEALNAAVATPEMRADLRTRGFVAMGGTAQELAKWTGEQAPVWGPVLQAAGVKPE
jgi:tripartite-type tricarboxylate transporter receptor subunit TctC